MGKFSAVSDEIPYCVAQYYITIIKKTVAQNGSLKSGIFPLRG
jgi:hypothetical protein